MDYMFMNSEDCDQEETGEDRGMPILVMSDQDSGVCFSSVVPKKGSHPYAIMRVSNDLAILGHEKLILMSDGEPAIKSLKEAVQADSSMKIEVSGRTGAPREQIIKEESPAYDSRSNGYIESVIKSIQGKIRTMKDALESRLGLKIRDEHPSLPWLVRHAGFIRSRFHIDESGR